MRRNQQRRLEGRVREGGGKTISRKVKWLSMSILYKLFNEYKFNLLYMYKFWNNFNIYLHQVILDKNFYNQDLLTSFYSISNTVAEYIIYVYTCICIFKLLFKSRTAFPET